MVSLHTQIGKEKKIFLEDRQMIELDGYYKKIVTYQNQTWQKVCKYTVYYCILMD